MHISQKQQKQANTARWSAMPPKKVWAGYTRRVAVLSVLNRFMSAMQGKGSKSKKLNETEEERAARLETEAAAAQEGARRREEAAR